MTTAAAQHAALGLKLGHHSVHTTHPAARWFPEAGLGLFIHWGIAGVHGGLDLSWSMMANTPWDSSAGGANKTTPEKYWELAERFQPDNYRPQRWLTAARAAGFQYAVLTTMHHDGYTLWPTQWGELGVQSHMEQRDLVRPFVEACREAGLKVGLYYSPPDWYLDRSIMSFNYLTHGVKAGSGAAVFDVRHEVVPARPDTPERKAARRNIFHNRVEELLTWYGHIDLLWFDGGDHDNAIRDRARELQPHLVINSRSCDGDFDSSECGLPTEPVRGWFEACHCWQQSEIHNASGVTTDFWGYLQEERYKPAAWMLEHLVQMRALGGNFLVNVGPRPNGELPDVVFERFAEVETWMRHSRDSVIGARPGPSSSPCNVPVTVNGDREFLHALPDFAGRIAYHRAHIPSSVTLLRTGRPLQYMYSEGILSVDIPPAERTPLIDVVAVR